MAKDWSKIYKKYKGLWVALAKDEMTVLGSGVTVQEAVKKAKMRSAETPFLTRVPNSLSAYVGSI